MLHQHFAENIISISHGHPKQKQPRPLLGKLGTQRSQPLQHQGTRWSALISMQSRSHHPNLLSAWDFPELKEQRSILFTSTLQQHTKAKFNRLHKLHGINHLTKEKHPFLLFLHDHFRTLAAFQRDRFHPIFRNLPDPSLPICLPAHRHSFWPPFSHLPHQMNSHTPRSR